jgi:hypothetical protein
MSENSVEMTPEQLEEAFKSVPEAFQDAISTLNQEVDSHNSKVESVRASEAKDPKLIKAEIYEQNPNNNKKLKVLYTEELKLREQIENLRKQAYEVIETDGLMPKELSPEEIEKLKVEVTESTKELREKVSALLKLEEMMPFLKGKLGVHIHEIKTRRGAAKTGTTTSNGDGPKRIRFKKIEVNGVTEDDKGNKVYGLKDGEEKYTFTFASMYLKKQHKTIKWTAKDLTDAYLQGEDENNLPDEKEFEMPLTFKDENGNDQTLVYKVKCYR